MKSRESQYDKLNALYRILLTVAEMPKGEVRAFLQEYEKQYGSELAKLFANHHDLIDIGVLINAKPELKTLPALDDINQTFNMTDKEYQQQIEESFVTTADFIHEVDPLNSHIAYAAYALMSKSINQIDEKMLQATYDYLRDKKFPQNITSSLEFLLEYKKGGNKNLRELLQKNDFKFSYLNLQGADLRGVNFKGIDMTGIDTRGAKTDLQAQAAHGRLYKSTSQHDMGKHDPSGAPRKTQSSRKK